ncbi:hypothetical protein [Lelliottia sp. WAP21]|uniref:hypothetical protein n=1 Tax=Lelliottia sp. WAP21 TaxID=2877426 RepID=UPI001E5615DE|nr:hypothetical protein [Lelliottia sp. WAP21]
MNDIRDISCLAAPIYRNDYFGAREVMSHAGAPAGMERALRTTNISAMNVRSVANSQNVFSGFTTGQKALPPVQQHYKLRDITGEATIGGQTNLGDMNKRLALFVINNLSMDNTILAKKTVETLVGELMKDTHYLNVTAQDTFSTLSFVISDIKNWDGTHRGIVIPDWAVKFFTDCKHEIEECAKDIHDQLKGNHHARRFAKKTELMRNKDFDKAFSESTTKAQHLLMLKAGERFLSEEFGVTEIDALAHKLLAYHDAVVKGMSDLVCQHIIASAAEKLSIVLTKDDAHSLIERNHYYKNFHQRADKLKNDLLACKVLHPSLLKSALGHIHSGHPVTEYKKEFIKIAGRLLANAYSFPVPDKFINSFFEG